MYNWNLFENSEICLNYDECMKYAEMWIDTNYDVYREKAYQFSIESLLSEFSSLSKENQKRLLKINKMTKTA